MRDEINVWMIILRRGFSFISSVSLALFIVASTFQRIFNCPDIISLRRLETEKLDLYPFQHFPLDRATISCLLPLLFSSFCSVWRFGLGTYI